MKREQSGPFLSAVFVDYDNIYMSLKRKSEEAAKRFAKDAMSWLKQIETGSLITATNGLSPNVPRRIVMNRCYGNPVPRRNTSDNSTDMSSFPFIRHHFLRAGFEVVDCPPLTAQLKNSSDIRMVMDLRDYLDHQTYFDEFIILSGDADFTPVLHRLRAHARRTVIYATDYTAAPYTAISDGEVREADLISLLIDGRIADDAAPAEIAPPAPVISLEQTRRAILDEVTQAVRTANAPVPLEVLADRAVRAIGHDRTIGTQWGGAGGFRELLSQGLPAGLRLSGEPPYVVIDTQRHIAQQPQRIEAQPLPPSLDIGDVRPERPNYTGGTDIGIEARDHRAFATQTIGRHIEPPAASQQISTGAYAAAEQPRRRILSEPQTFQQPQQAQPAKIEPPVQQTAAPSIQSSIARIHEACKAPPLAPPEYRMLFELIAQEINDNGLIGAQTIQNIVQRSHDRGIDVRRDDVRFILEVVSEADPWFEQGASATLFAGRFRNFVVARCRAQGLTLSADELDLVEAWFAGSGLPTASVRHNNIPAAPTFAAAPPTRQQPALATDGGYWGNIDETRPQQTSDVRSRSAPAQETGEMTGDDFPRIVRTRLRG